MLKTKIIICSFIWGCLFSPFFVNADIIHLAPGDFQPKVPNEYGVYIYTGMGGWDYYLYVESEAHYPYLYSRCLDLPHLGTLDQVRIFYFDNSSSFLDVYLVRQKFADGSVDVLASFTSKDIDSYIRTVDLETFSYPTIKAKGYRYFLKVNFGSGSDQNIRLYGIRVRYYGPSG